MSRSDLRPGAARLQQEAILDSMAARSAVRCPECTTPTGSNLLRKLLALTGHRCTGQVCPACKWEGEPIATLDSQGRVVRATTEGLPTDEVLGLINTQTLASISQAANRAQIEVWQLAVAVVESVVGR
jgi:hypothetical protein